MRIENERNFESVKAMVDDPLSLYRSAARRAIDTPTVDPSDVHYEESEGFDPEVARAFARVAQFLDGLDAEEAAFTIERDSTLAFLTPSNAEPLVNTEEGQLVRLRRGRDGRVVSVTVMRSDDKAVTSSDMRFPFRVVKDTDAEVRIAQSWTHRFNLEYSDSAVAKDRAEAAQEQLKGIKGDEKYQLVADLYLMAEEAGYSSTRHLIIEKMDVSDNYAGVLISRARDKGYLPKVIDKSKGST